LWKDIVWKDRDHFTRSVRRLIITKPPKS
jgi:hypothetical protein